VDKHDDCYASLHQKLKELPTSNSLIDQGNRNFDSQKYELLNSLARSRDKQQLGVMESPREQVQRHHHLFAWSLHTNKETEISVFVKVETNGLTICKMDQPIDLQQVCDYVLKQVFHATSIHCGSTKTLVLHRDDRLAGQKIDDDVDVEQPIQLAHFDRQDCPSI